MRDLTVLSAVPRNRRLLKEEETPLMPKDPEPTRVPSDNPPRIPPVLHRYRCLFCGSVVLDTEYPGLCFDCGSVLWFAEQGPFYTFRSE